MKEMIIVVIAACLPLVGCVGRSEPQAIVRDLSDSHVVPNWDTPLEALRQTTNSAAFAKARMWEVENTVVTGLFPKAQIRIYRANYWYKPGHPETKGIMTQQQYILRKGDARLYRFGNAHDMIALAKAEGLALLDEEKVRAFAGIACHSEEVVSAGDSKWELTQFGSGRPVKWVRVLTVDKDGVPISITEPQELLLGLEKSFITKDSTLSTEGAPSVEK